MLPGLEPHHTRSSFCSGSRLYVEKIASSPTDFLVSEENGLWLLPPSVAERDRAAGELSLGKLATVQHAEGMKDFCDTTKQASEILARTVITDLGCMVDGASSEQIVTHEFAQYLASQERGSPVLDDPEDGPYLKACPTDNCYNSRHFDFQFGRARTLDLNPLWFNVDEEGSVFTIWGDQLPSLRESMQSYIQFQRKNYPYVPINESLLTSSAVAQIGFHPLTGCWETWNYHRKPAGAKGGRFAGYGNFYIRDMPGGVDADTGEIVIGRRRGTWMAHRVTWGVEGNELVQGKVLNHRCNYKRCCNPGHLEQVSESYNVRHGLVAQSAIKALVAGNASAAGHRLSAKELALLEANAPTIYAELTNPV